MTDKELSRLGRRELLEMLIAIKRQNEELKAKNEELEEAIRDRTIRIRKSGTLAEAALAINELFENADRTAAQYIENIRICREQQEKEYKRSIEDAHRQAEAILAQAEDEKLKIMCSEKT